MTDDTKVIEFIPREQWEQTLSVEAQKSGPVRLSKELNRRAVVSAFMDAFEMVGGVQRLAQWAMQDENYGDFLKLYARLMPSQAVELDDSAQKKYFGHVLPRSKLDE